MTGTSCKSAQLILDKARAEKLTINKNVSLYNYGSKARHKKSCWPEVGGLTRIAGLVMLQGCAEHASAKYAWRRAEAPMRRKILI